MGLINQGYFSKAIIFIISIPKPSEMAFMLNALIATNTAVPFVLLKAQKVENP
jgi:hypothetical protein